MPGLTVIRSASCQAVLRVLLEPLRPVAPVTALLCVRCAKLFLPISAKGASAFPVKIQHAERNSTTGAGSVDLLGEIENFIRANEVKALLLSRFLVAPFSLKNYGLGTLPSVSTRTFAWTSVVGDFPMKVAFSYTGASIGSLVALSRIGDEEAAVRCAFTNHPQSIGRTWLRNNGRFICNRSVGLAGWEKPWFLIMLSAVSLATTLAMGVILGYRARQILTVARTEAARPEQELSVQQDRGNYVA